MYDWIKCEDRFCFRVAQAVRAPQHSLHTLTTKKPERRPNVSFGFSSRQKLFFFYFCFIAKYIVVVFFFLLFYCYWSKEASSSSWRHFHGSLTCLNQLCVVEGARFEWFLCFYMVRSTFLCVSRDFNWNAADNLCECLCCSLSVWWESSDRINNWKLVCFQCYGKILFSMSSDLGKEMGGERYNAEFSLICLLICI